MATLKILAGAYSSVIATLLFSTNPPSLSILKTSQAGFSPTWITPHPANKSIVYATQEYTAGQIWSFVVNADGSLTKLATISTGGDSPVYVGVSDDQSQLLVPNVRVIKILHRGYYLDTSSTVWRRSISFHTTNQQLCVIRDPFAYCSLQWIWTESTTTELPSP